MLEVVKTATGSQNFHHEGQDVSVCKGELWNVYESVKLIRRKRKVLRRNT